MTIIDRKTNGQFPGRKKRETNGIRPMRTDMSVVSQSYMYEGANMSNKGLRMSNSLVRISIVSFILLLVYLAFLLIDMDFYLFWLKVKWTIFSKSLRLLFSRLGFGGLCCIGVTCALLDPENVSHFMAPSGQNCEKEGTSSTSGSGNFRLYINLSSDKEGDSAPEPSTDRTPGHLPQGGGAPGQPAGEREPEAPTIDEFISKMKLLLRGHRKLRSDVLKKIQEDIRLETASPQKRIKMNEYLDYVSNNRDSLLNSGQSLVYEFTVRVNDWEREQRHFPNPVDDVP